MSTPITQAEDRARWIRGQLPAEGLFAGQEWRVAPDPFPITRAQFTVLENLGRWVTQFYRASNLLYRQSAEGRQPSWVSNLLDQGKDPSIVAWQRHPAFKNEIPRVIRPDLLVTEDGFAITELDSVPGGIGLTAWLNQVYSSPEAGFRGQLVGTDRSMLDGFAGIFGDAPHVHLVVSDESGSYRPEMDWVAGQLGRDRFQVRDVQFTGFAEKDAVYRFFECFDLPNVPSAETALRMASEKRLRLTPAIKPALEEKLFLALLWNRNLRAFWHRELGEGFLNQLLKCVPYSWVVDPTPLPPHAAIPKLEITDWTQLKQLSQRDRDLILKISGYSDQAWGARGVHLGSDLSTADWSAAVDRAIQDFPRSPYVLQRYHKPKVVDYSYFDFETGKVVAMPGRARLTPYYFVHGDGDGARAQLGGVLATVCPADKKIIHGMRDAVMAPCRVVEDIPG